MKKILSIFVFLLISGAMFAQFGTTYDLGATGFKKIVSPVAGDTIHGSDPASTTHYYNFFVNKKVPYYFTFAVKLDSTLTHHRVTGNHVWVQVLGSIDGVTYANIGTVVKYGAGADSVFSYSDVTTGQIWDYLKIRFSGVTANRAATLKALTLKVSNK